jgi:hypothetical protein
MEITGSHLTVAQLVAGLEDGSIEINRNYQRQAGVWPAEAQSFLIETILLGYPVPKLTFHVITDRLTRRTKSEIVDGQQRATAIRSFLDDEFSLSRNVEIEEARRQTYSSLPSGLQQRLLSYSLGIDQLVDVAEEQIREIFRRINSYEVPLNPEEQRHAKHQGPFKWFIYRIAKEYGDQLKEMGTFTERQLIRMADMKLLAEICHALLNGITTTDKRALDKLYDSRNADFDEEQRFGEWLRLGFDLVGSLPEVHGTILMRQFSVYSLLLAIIHAKHDVPSLRPIGPGGRGLAQRAEIVQALSRQLEALENEDEAVGYERLRRAFEKGTNVATERVARAQFFLDAVSASE